MKYTKHTIHITLHNTKHPDYYNKCTECNSITNLQECNHCIELYCVKCDILNHTNCRTCTYYKDSLKKK